MAVQVMVAVRMSWSRQSARHGTVLGILARHGTSWSGFGFWVFALWFLDGFGLKPAMVLVPVLVPAHAWVLGLRRYAPFSANRQQTLKRGGAP